MMMNNHFFHLVKYSPWPAVMAMNMINLGVGIMVSIILKTMWPVSMALLMTLLIKFQWWRDIVREALYEGCHNPPVKEGISLGVMMFIVSELCFFVSFFWMYFYLSLSPEVSIASSWPPRGISSVDCASIPLLNTMILLASGFFITWSHHSMINNKAVVMKTTCVASIALGIYFFGIQMYEYMQLPFEFSDSAFGSSFFTLTGFHGFHVVVGILFITVNYLRTSKLAFSNSSHAGLEYSIWYWHFVDVVWLFLFVFVYWWSM